MTTHLGLQRILLPSAQVSSLTSGSITLPSARGAFAVAGDFESIATYQVTGGGINEITFSAIPQTYTHLQIRANQQTSAYDRWNIIEYNADTTASNYFYHQAATQGNATGQQTGVGSYVYYQAVASHSVTTMAGQIIDILDYKNTTKYKTMRHISGQDNNGSGEYRFGDVLWKNTSAINQIVIKLLSPGGVVYAVGSRWSLYGIRGAL